MLYLTLAVIPLVLVIRTPRRGAALAEHAVMD
jgi:hypothetical protein